MAEDLKLPPSLSGYLRAMRVYFFQIVAWAIQYIPLLQTAYDIIPIEYRSLEIALVGAILAGLDKYARAKGYYS